MGVLDFQRHERCLAPSTLHHYELCVGEFLAWLDRKGKPLEEVTLEDISGYFEALAQRKLKRTSIALHVAKLRNFLRCLPCTNPTSTHCRTICSNVSV